MLAFVGFAVVGLTMPISLGIGLLLLVVSASYFQTILSYPMGGGSYRVSTENLGSVAGRIAGASLLIDYVLTVSVSVTAGVGAIISMAPGLQNYVVELGVIAVVLVGIINLRGAKESGLAFAIPTYSFVVLILALIGTGAFMVGRHTAPGPAPLIPGLEKVENWALLFLVLKAFAAGCTALTGVEAIADGVQAFKPPESKNASMTLAMMAALLLVMFIGLSWLTQHFVVVPMNEHDPGYKTLVAQIASVVFPQWLYYALQIATALILVLAANTAFADFPRLSSFIAKDGYLPRQLLSVGDRLVFQNGIILLTIVSSSLIIAFRGQTALLIPLYAVGVFTSFTLSQAGMFRKLVKEKSALWKQLVSLFGATVTFVVMCVILVTKFTHGAYLIVIAVGLLLLLFWRIRLHYNYLARELSLEPNDEVKKMRSTAILLVPRLHKGILHAISYAQTLAHDVRAIHVTLDPQNTDQIKQDWMKFGADIPLVIVESPYRSMLEPIIDYVDQAIAEEPNHMITVIVPQAVPKRWWHGLLHNNAAIPLKIALASRKNVVITNVRYFLK
jgi:amino acid transporter